MNRTVSARRLRLAILGILVPLIVGLVAWVVHSMATGAGDAISFTALVVTVIAALFQVLGFFQEGRGGSMPVTALADDLAETVGGQWLDEAAARRLRDPGVLPLSWRQTSRAVIDEAARAIPYERLSGRLAGNFDRVIARLGRAYQDLPAHRIVVLGEPGAGKTVLALLLLLGLLKRRTSGEPVPVLLPASSWDPLTETMDGWIARSLSDTYYSGRMDVATRLIARGLILPIIDGLDEIPEFGRREAIEKINRAIGRERPIVVTCRSVEYQDLIRAGAPTLRQAPVVEVDPLRSGDVIAYLAAVDWPAGTSWKPVFERLVSSREDPISQALSTPLMVSSARLVYERLGSDPAVLLDHTQFGSRHAVENSIIDRVIDAAYAPTPAAGAEARPAKWSADDARGYLTYLARYMHGQGERELKWWRLSGHLLSNWLPPVAGVIGGAVVMTAVTVWLSLFTPDGDPRFDGLSVGIITGAGYAILATLIWYAAGGNPPGRLAFTIRESTTRLSRGFWVGARAAVIPAIPIVFVAAVSTSVTDFWTLATIEDYLRLVFSLGGVISVIAAAMAVNGWLNARPVRAGRADPAESLKQDRLASLVCAGSSGVIVGLLLLPAYAVGRLAGTLVAAIAHGWSGWPGEADLHALSLAYLHESLDLYANVTYGLGAFLLLSSVFALLTLSTRAWPRFLLTRLVTSLKGDLPRDLMGFLADARSRDLLRQSASSFQFRHIRLQERLANVAVADDGQVNGEEYEEPRRRTEAPSRQVWVTALTALAGILAGVAYALPDDQASAIVPGRFSATDYTLEVSGDGHAYGAIYSRSDSLVRIVDANHGSVIRTIPTGLNGVTDVQMTPDNQLVIVVATPGAYGLSLDRPIRIYRVTTGELVLAASGSTAFLSPSTGPFLGVVEFSFQRSSKFDDTVRIINTRTGAVCCRQKGEFAETFPAFSGSFVVGPRADSIVLGQPDHSLLMWAVSGELSGPPRARIAGATADQAALSPDGRTLRVVTDRGFQFWSTVTGHPIATVGKYEVDLGTFSADGSRFLATTGGSRSTMEDDDTITAWATDSGQEVFRATGLTGPISATFAGSRNNIVEYTSGSTKIWNPQTRRPSAPIATSERRRFISGPGGDAMLTATDRGIDGEDWQAEMWDLPSGRLRFSMPITRATGDYAQFYGDSELLSQPIRVSNSGVLMIIPDRGGSDTVWNLTENERISVDSATIQRATLSSRTGLFVLMDRFRAELFDERGNLRGRLQGAPLPVVGPAGFEESWPEIVISPDGKSLATLALGADSVQVWDAQDGRLLRTLTGHVGLIQKVTYSPDSRAIITVGSDNTVRFWRLDAWLSR